MEVHSDKGCSVAPHSNHCSRGLPGSLIRWQLSIFLLLWGHSLSRPRPRGGWERTVSVRCLPLAFYACPEQMGRSSCAAGAQLRMSVPVITRGPITPWNWPLVGNIHQMSCVRAEMGKWKSPMSRKELGVPEVKGHLDANLSKWNCPLTDGGPSSVQTLPVKHHPIFF